jgi:hypothetical protein
VKIREVLAGRVLGQAETMPPSIHCWGPDGLAARILAMPPNPRSPLSDTERRALEALVAGACFDDELK